MLYFFGKIPYLYENVKPLAMKRILMTLLLSAIPFALFGQQVAFTAFDTNSPMGEILFNQNEKGEIIYTGVVETPFSADTVLGLAREYLYTIEKKYNARISDRFKGVTRVACDVELPVGVRYINAYWAGVFAKPAATVRFNLVIDIRPGKYRYTLTNFKTDRWRIHGEGKDNGPSNMIHCQRVNSLQKELGKARKKDKEELSTMIEKEKASYEGEYKSVMDFIEGLKTFAVISDDF